MKNLKIQIRSAQNVGKVWISRQKNHPGPVWGHLRPYEAIFSMDWKNKKDAKRLPILLGGPMGPIHPGGGCELVYLAALPAVCKTLQLERHAQQGVEAKNIKCFCMFEAKGKKCLK